MVSLKRLLVRGVMVSGQFITLTVHMSTAQCAYEVTRRADPSATPDACPHGHNLTLYNEHFNVNCHLDAFVCRSINVWNRLAAHVVNSECLQCIDAVGWAAGRASGL